jgi:lysophospholipase L1-like esterase
VVRQPPVRTDPAVSAATAVPKTGERRFTVRKQILFSTIIVVGLLLAAEGAVRVWALYFRTSYERYNSRTGRLELTPGIKYTNSRGEEFWINSKGFVGPEFDDQPPRGVYRIIGLGDSCTFTTGFWQLGYPSILESRLNDGRASRRFEVINAGIEGYNSTFALERIRDELLRYRPHLMIIYIGWNDLMKTDPASESSVDRYRGLAVAMDSSYLVKAYKKTLFVNLRPVLFPPATEDRPEDSEAFDEFTPLRYRSNLEEMIRLLRKNGVAVLLVTLPTVVRPGMTREELQGADVFFPHFAGAYGVSRLLSLHRAYNRVIREVGRREEAEVVDLAAVFESIPDRTPYFWDTMHPNQRGSARIAEALAGRLRALETEGRL